jgi:hypothetical protein
MKLNFQQSRLVDHRRHRSAIEGHLQLTTADHSSGELSTDCHFTKFYSHFQAEVLVDREVKKLNDARAYSSKIKRQLHASSRDLEKVDMQLDLERIASPKVKMKVTLITSIFLETFERAPYSKIVSNEGRNSMNGCSKSSFKIIIFL